MAQTSEVDGRYACWVVLTHIKQASIMMTICSPRPAASALPGASFVMQQQAVSPA